MAGQNHKLQTSKAQPTGTLRCAGLGFHRQIQQMILSRHDSVIHPRLLAKAGGDEYMLDLRPLRARVEGELASAEKPGHG